MGNVLNYLGAFGSSQMKMEYQIGESGSNWNQGSAAEGQIGDHEIPELDHELFCLKLRTTLEGELIKALNDERRPLHFKGTIIMIPLVAA